MDQCVLKQPNVTRVQTRRVCLFARLRILPVKRLGGYATWQAAWQSTRQGQTSDRLQAIAFDRSASGMKRRTQEGVRSHGNLGLYKSSVGGTSLPLCVQFADVANGMALGRRRADRQSCFPP